MVRFLCCLAILSRDELQAAAPYTHTQRAIPNSTTNAIIAGMVVPNGEPTIAWFEWSPDGSFDQTTAPTNLGNGNSVIRITSTIVGLGAEGSCRFRLVASNASGTVYGNEQRFKSTRKVLATPVVIPSLSPVPPPSDLTNIVASDSGNYHCLTLRANGQLVAWGLNNNSQTNVPASISNVVMIASAQNHNLVLQENGVLRGFGDNSFGVRTPPGGLSNIIAIATGGYRSIALKADGTVAIWGLDAGLFTELTAGLSNVVAIAAGSDHQMVLLADGTVISWGSNLNGQTNVPVGLTNVMSIAANNELSAALRRDGSIVLWGMWSNSPVIGPNIISIEDGHGVMALRADGTVVSWNSSGTATVRTGITNATALGGGWLSVLGSNTPPTSSNLKVTGAANHPLEIKLVGADPESDPLRFRILSLPADGQLHQFDSGSVGSAITETNTLVGDATGRLWFVPNPDSVGTPYGTFDFHVSDGEFKSSPATVTVDFVGHPYVHTQIAAPITSASAQLNGMVSANGFQTTAWFEWGTSLAYGQVTAPTLVGTSANVTRLNANLDGLLPSTVIYYRLIASNQIGMVSGKPERFTTGQLVTVWGPNNYGQLNVPAGLTNAVAIAGVNHRVVLKADGAVIAWGQNSYSQAAVPASATNIIAIAASGEHNLALRADSTVMGWGRFDSGQTFPPPGLSNVIAIATGDNHSLALRQDGTVVAWGYNGYGQTNVPPELKNVVAIAGGFFSSLALKADGTVVAWGYQSNSLVPPGLSNVVAIRNLLALKSDGTVARLGTSINPPAGLTNGVAITDFSVLKEDGSVVSWSGTPPPAGLSNIVKLESTSAIGPNLPPVAVPQSIVSAANQDILITLASSDSNGDLRTHRIAALPAAGSLFQFEAGGRGAAILSPNTPVSDLQHRVIFAPGTNELGAPYAQFSFIANDGAADSSPATVSVTLVGSPFATTLPPVATSPTSAELVGMVLPNGFPMLAWFEWGTNQSFIEKTPPIPVAPGSSVVSISSTLSNLTFGKIYWSRIVASNVTGLAYGSFKPWTSRALLTAWGYTNPNFPGPLQPPPSATNITAIATGPFHSLGRRRDGTVVAWGNNNFSQTNVPVGLSNVVQVAAGAYSSITLKRDGTVTSWGYTGTTPNTLSNVVAVSVTAGGSGVALLTNGTVKSWWNGAYRTVPTGLTNIVAIEGTLALKADGTVLSWTSGTTNLTLIEGLSNIVAVTVGDTFSLGLKSDGTVAAWGSGSGTNVPGNLSNVVAIAAGGSFAMALHHNGNLSAWGSYGDDPTAIPEGISNVVAIASGQAYRRNLALMADLSVVTSPATFTGYVNTDLPIPLPAYKPSGGPLNLRLRSLPTAGMLCQFMAGQRGAPITDTNTLISDPEGRVVFVPAPNGIGSPYSTFNFLSTDATTNSPAAAITINIILPAAPQMSASNSGWVLPTPPQLTAISNGLHSGWAFSFGGHSNLVYSVWASTNLADWELLGSVTWTNGNQFGFQDAAATNFSRRFYRISTPANRGYAVSFTGDSNATYRVWASTNLTHWQLLGPAIPASNGWFQYTDFGASQWPQRFYKAGAP
jgi:alpha-tubulin suppressor-like RCC1 family protein